MVLKKNLLSYALQMILLTSVLGQDEVEDEIAEAEEILEEEQAEENAEAASVFSSLTATGPLDASVTDDETCLATGSLP